MKEDELYLVATSLNVREYERYEGYERFYNSNIAAGKKRKRKPPQICALCECNRSPYLISISCL